MKDLFMIRNFEVNGKEVSEWCKAGVAFNRNKDGSVNLQLYMFPDVKFQLREKTKKEDRENKSNNNNDVDWDEE